MMMRMLPQNLTIPLPTDAVSHCRWTTQLHCCVKSKIHKSTHLFAWSTAWH